MLAWRENCVPSLQTQPWRVVRMDASNGGAQGQGKEYLVKGLFDQVSGYHVMVSDSSTIWEEKMEAEEISRRMKLLNPNVEAPLPILLQTLSSHLEARQPRATYILTDTTPTSTNQITLSLQTMLTSLPLEWKFVLRKCDRDELCTQLVTPLLSMVGELARRQQELCSVLSKKDKEILDFRDQGYKVSRKYLETPQFIEGAFEHEMLSSPAFEETSSRSIQTFLNPASRKLYQDVNKMKKWLADKNETVALLETTLLTTPFPSSAVQPDHTSPIKDPPAAPASKKSPAKDEEKTRREDLERKLEESKNKPKRKKRKLM